MKSIIASVVIAGLLIVMAVAFVGNQKNGSELPATSTVGTDGKQVIEITARGGYSPRTVSAKADVPVVLRMITKGSLDCSSALVIPSIGYRKNLPLSGTTDIEIAGQPAGSTLRGLCAMGMYSFEVNFN